MTIYIETFLMQNILINFCLIKLIHSTTKCKTSFFRILVSSLLGTISSFLAIYFFENAFLLNSIKILTAIAMILIAFNQTKKMFISNFILLFLFTYAFGGLITSIASNTYLFNSSLISVTKFNLEIICIFIIFATYIFDLVVKHIKLKININNLIYSITLTHAKQSIKIQAYLDTGNFLNRNGEPVLILDLKSYLKLTKSNLIDFCLSKTENLHAGTINGSNQLKCFKIDKIIIKHKDFNKELNNQFVAINTSNCFKNTNYQALLSPLFL